MGASESAFQRLDELSTLIGQRLPHIAPLRPAGTSILHLLRAGLGARYVIWDREEDTYRWYGPSGRGAALGRTAGQAIELIAAALPAPVPPIGGCEPCKRGDHHLCTRLCACAH
ncbi:hypothetical protein [Actinomadura roseirufa]|uniref:hypothetical protein n=1 Tax=Actinomadura roseirufa TaxID=2094049 RepID=UPI00104109EE|nr:hypothetical protein [Actinomadura roseirufa]